MPFIIGAAILGGLTLAGSVYTSEQARKQASKARSEASRQAAATSQQAAAQLAEQRKQSQIAQERLSFEVNQSAQQRAQMEKQAQEAAQTLEGQQREMAEAEANRMRQLRRGGFRSLLSQERLSPEAGLGTYGSGSLGSGTNVR